MPEIIVGPGDDAGIYAIDGDRALVETVDIITPLVNDPATFGAISAVNSLSDIYAMGGSPITALAIIGFSSCDYEPPVIKEILRGALSVLKEAGVSLMGGHSIEDRELKFGLSVTGIISKKNILRARGARAGDRLIITKPIGTGILCTALKAGKLSDKDISKAIDSMLTLNKRASEVALRAGAVAATDVTGFGLLGHASNMVRDTNIDIEIDIGNVPVFEGVRDFIGSGIIPEGAYNNLRFIEEKVDFGSATEDERILLSDPQTSGGLLIAIPKEGLGVFEKEGIWFKEIGRVVEGRGRIRLI